MFSNSGHHFNMSLQYSGWMQNLKIKLMYKLSSSGLWHCRVM